MAKKCSTEDCTNTPIVNPRMILVAKGYEDSPAEMVAKIDLCFNCKNKFDKKKFLKDNWNQFCELFQTLGKLKPHFKSSSVDFVDIDLLENLKENNSKEYPC